MSTIYFSSDEEVNSTSVTVFEDMLFRELTGMNVYQAGCLEGTAEAPVRNITFDNVHFRNFDFPYWASYVEEFHASQSHPTIMDPNAEKCYI